jgi:hypothetical protein
MLTVKDHKMNLAILAEQVAKLERLGLNVKVNTSIGSAIDVHAELIKNQKTFIIIDIGFLEAPNGFSDVYLLRMVMKDKKPFNPKLNTKEDFHNAIDECIDNAEKYIKEL